MVQRITPESYFNRLFCQNQGAHSKAPLVFPPAVSMGDFLKPHQVATVPANTTDQLIYDFAVPKNYRAFVQYFGNNMFVNYSLKWVIDGQIVESGITREIGRVFDPTYFPMPYLAKSSVRVYATNNDAASVTAEVYVNGLVYNYVQFLNSIKSCGSC